MTNFSKYRGGSMQVVANGFILNVGCQTLVAETPEKLKKLICDYIDNPEQEEAKLMKSVNHENQASCGALQPRDAAEEVRAGTTRR